MLIFNLAFCALFLAAVGAAPEKPSTRDVDDFRTYLKKTVNGQVEEPLTPEMEELQNPWERSGNFQGDMVLTPEQQEELVESYSGERNAITYKKWLWTDKTVYYHISVSSYNDEQKAAIEAGIKEIARNSCLKFVKRDSSTVNYIYIKGTDSGCRSYVGMIGGAQTLNLEPRSIGSGCFKPGTIIHEMLHALGFHHMQSTSNRDDYVKVVWDKIKAGHEKNFVKYDDTAVTNFGERYDYGSIMHYSEYGFSTDGSKTLIPLVSTSQTIGQRVKMSDKDIKKLNKLYDCPGF